VDVSRAWRGRDNGLDARTVGGGGGDGEEPFPPDLPSLSPSPDLAASLRSLSSVSSVSVNGTTVNEEER
jgi:hypothetical protein